ncbi:MAG: DUF885 family protein [Rhodanobacteraceae bacterium]
MKYHSGCWLIATLLLTGGACAATLTNPGASRDCAQAPNQSAADRRFQQIYKDEWTWREAQFPGLDDDPDANVPDDRLPRIDAASQNARLRRWRDVLRDLDTITVDQLTPANRINYAVYRPQVENLAADVRYKNYLMPFNSDSSFWSDLGFMAQRKVNNTKQYRDYIAKLNDIPRYFDEEIANMRAGLARGFSVPRAVLDGRDVSIATVANVAKPEDSAFYAPFRHMPTTISADEQAKLRTDAIAAIRRSVIPAYAKLLVFFRDTYVPHARTTLAAEALPDGKAFYRQQIREYTTLDLDPDAIHAIGLAEVARIHGEMLKTMRDAAFHGTFAEFLHFLRTDPRFYAKTPDELLMRASWIAKRVDGKLGRFFGLLPRGRFGVKPVPADIAPFWTSGRGGADTYWVNTYDLKSRPLYNLPALTLHESAPGHSLQLSLAKEQTGMPAFRRKTYISAYGEGWGLYSEYLGEEMGIYTTPYDEFGRLTYAMWRACRLVVDTGIHHLGWTRDRAITYLADNTALSTHEIETEVDRYISWPGQALSYKLGEMKILALRRKAQSALGSKFDLRAFHDTVLGTGSVPLPVLEQIINAWIAGGGKAMSATNAPCNRPVTSENRHRPSIS